MAADGIRSSDWSSDLCSSDLLSELRPGDDASHAAIRDTFQPFVVPFHHLVGATEQLIAANADRAEWRTVRIQFMALAVATVLSGCLLVLSLVREMARADKLRKTAEAAQARLEEDRKSTRLNSSH